MGEHQSFSLCLCTSCSDDFQSFLLDSMPKLGPLTLCSCSQPLRFRQNQVLSKQALSPSPSSGPSPIFLFLSDPEQKLSPSLGKANFPRTLILPVRPPPGHCSVLHPPSRLFSLFSNPFLSPHSHAQVAPVFQIRWPLGA